MKSSCSWQKRLTACTLPLLNPNPLLMSMSLNRAQVIGNLTRDPEVRQTSSGRTVVNLGIATNSRWTDSNGQQQERTEFHNIVVWGKLADICAQYLRKGSKIYIEGRLQTRDWEGQDGVKRYRTEIVADNMIMLDSRGGTSGGSMMQRESGGMSQSQGSQVPQGEIAVEDLPF
jgi:single-strand DNA-binding protein